MGQGAMTGREMGWCGDANARVDVPPRGPGIGLGRGGGRGGGWRHRHGLYAIGQRGWQRERLENDGFSPPLSKKQELAALKQQAERIEHTLGGLKSRILELSNPEPGTGATTEK